MIFLFWAMITFAAPEDTNFSRHPLVMVDDAKKDESFLAFREQLLGIVKKKDAKALLAVTDPKIKNSFGGEDGVKEFRATWKLDGKGASKSDLWPELAKVLTNGGVLREGKFIAPYYFASWPGGFDAFEFVAVIEKDAPLRKSASTRGAVVAMLPAEIVARADGMKDTPTFTYVRTADGKLGYVLTRQTGSPVGYRAFFEKKDGQWRLTTFIAGD